MERCLTKILTASNLATVALAHRPVLYHLGYRCIWRSCVVTSPNPKKLHVDQNQNRSCTLVKIKKRSCMLVKIKKKVARWSKSKKKLHVGQNQKRRCALVKMKNTNACWSKSKIKMRVLFFSNIYSSSLRLHFGQKSLSSVYPRSSGRSWSLWLSKFKIRRGLRHGRPSLGFTRNYKKAVNFWRISISRCIQQVGARRVFP